MKCETGVRHSAGGVCVCAVHACSGVCVCVCMLMHVCACVHTLDLSHSHPHRVKPDSRLPTGPSTAGSAVLGWLCKGAECTSWQAGGPRDWTGTQWALMVPPLWLPSQAGIQGGQRRSAGVVAGRRRPGAAGL